jgi:hypothetical protein
VSYIIILPRTFEAVQANDVGHDKQGYALLVFKYLLMLQHEIAA